MTIIDNVNLIYFQVLTTATLLSLPNQLKKVLQADHNSDAIGRVNRSFMG
ncbi:MAG: hypothetical protein F6K63_29065 [Moorea sp. SIO1G6]|nr:hypothetical protein [Moorena sp. SIO1G6]NET68225.1 hypothetical protein [Moorena sp. SIO1G6]